MKYESIEIRMLLTSPAEYSRKWIALTHADYIRAAGVLCHLCANAAICAFGIDKLRQNIVESLLLGGTLNRTPFALMSR
jgi:hypothetical protein